MTAARDERAALIETLRAVGPAAPTLCEGWRTRDIVAHMVIREARLDAAPGILVPALAGYTQRIQKGYARRDWTALVGQLADGPPWYSPLRPLDRIVNAGEMFVHHEDVRRAQKEWSVRTLDTELTASLRRQLPLIAKRALRTDGVRVALATPDGSTIAAVGSGSPVTLTGEPGELLLYAFGRDEVDVSFTGDADAVASVQHADRSA